MLLLLLIPGSGRADDNLALETEFRGLQSRALAASHAYYAPRQWQTVFTELDRFTQRAEELNFDRLIVDAQALKAI